MDDYEFELLRDAASKIADSAKTYVNLREMLSDTSSAGKEKFKKEFARYYKLNSAGLTAEWKATYFDLLFAFGEKMPAEPHQVALRKLYPIKNFKERETLQCSFVSKLVNIHDESQPIFDQNVRRYFGIEAPSLSLAEFRITGFIRNLREIGRRYDAWSDDTRFDELIRDLQTNNRDLAKCGRIRICDFLVWQVVSTLDHDFERSR